MGLEGISFNPSESVTYLPENAKQSVQLTITNSGSLPVIYKWKSTRPGIYKMRPVYGRIAAGDHGNVSLIFKGHKQGTTVPLKDHFTCILTVATSSSMDVQRMWKNHKNKREIANQPVRKHKLNILYKGHNDQQVEMTPLENDISDKRNKVRIKKGKGLVDEEDEKPPAANVGAGVAGGGVEKIQLVFRDQACPLSDSDSEKEDDSDKDNDKTKSINGGKSVASKSSMSRAGGPAEVKSSANPSVAKEMSTAPTAKLATATPGAPVTPAAASQMKTAAPPAPAATPGAATQMKTAAPPAPAAVTPGTSQMKTAAPAPAATPAAASQMKTAAPTPTPGAPMGLSQMKTAPPAAPVTPAAASQMKTAAPPPQPPAAPKPAASTAQAPINVSLMKTAPPAKIGTNQKK